MENSQIFLIFTTDKAPYTAIEPPFDIPESWEWVKLSDIVFNLGQKTPTEKFCYIDVGLIDNKKHKLENTENFIEAKNAPSRARKLIQNGSILYSTVRPYLQNICIIDNTFKYEPIASTAFAVMNVFTDFYNKYLFYYLLSPPFTDFVNQEMVGVAYPAINDEKLYNFLVPIPPLNEQHRIVAKIEELLPFIEQYDKQEQALKTLNKNFSEQLKKSILQAAIQGKLTERLPTDESASELLKRIEAEKVRLISEGKLKKPRVRDNSQNEKFEPPFKIPQGWEWVRLADVSVITMGQSPDNKYIGNIGIEFHQGKSFFTEKYISKSSLYCSQSSKIAEKNSILLCVRAPVGIVNLTNRVLCIGRGLAAINPIILDYKFLFYLLRCYQNYYESLSTGSTFKAINRDIIDETFIPLPPLEEQKRIVEKVELLLSQIERL
ncbi:restriction endonuclease subunit S [Mannheimia cairinae]|uniref:restriction endonuclease subunit S n=1 Tax=Mannheimia cairinae TaxID=3025936 RepID=UPI00336A8BDA